MEAAYSLQLAMAALVGASFAAVSAFYMHGETVNQVLHLAKILERSKSYSAATDGGEEMDDLKRYYSRPRRVKRSRRRSGRGSASPPKSYDLARGIDCMEAKLEVPMLEDAEAAFILRHNDFPEMPYFSPGES